MLKHILQKLLDKNMLRDTKENHLVLNGRVATIMKVTFSELKLPKIKTVVEFSVV